MCKHTAVLLARLMLDAVVPGVTMYMYVCVHGFMKCSIQNSIIVFFSTEMLNAVKNGNIAVIEQVSEKLNSFYIPSIDCIFFLPNFAIFS